MPCHDEAQRTTTPVEARLWLKVDKNGPTQLHQPAYGNCWLWTGHLGEGGYGRLYRHFPDPVLTHRLAWEIATGDTLVVADVIGHVCDVRHCVRNDDEGTYEVAGVILPRRGHLFKGTHTNNALDTVQKGRQGIGERNAQAKLTEASVREIRAQYASGAFQLDLALEFGVKRQTISSIVSRRSWKHID